MVCVYIYIYIYIYIKVILIINSNCSIVFQQVTFNHVLPASNLLIVRISFYFCLLKTPIPHRKGEAIPYNWQYMAKCWILLDTKKPIFSSNTHPAQTARFFNNCPIQAMHGLTVGLGGSKPF